MIYPNKGLLHPDPQVIASLKLAYPRFQWLFPIYGSWSYAIFYTVAELWGNIGINILFWQFANEVTRTEEAKRYYSLFGFLGNFALIAAGYAVSYFNQFQKGLPAGVDGFGTSLNFLMTLVVLAGAGIGGIYFWMNKTVLTDPRYYEGTKTSSKSKSKKKSSLGGKFQVDHCFEVSGVHRNLGSWIRYEN